MPSVARIASTDHPTLLQINTRLWLRELIRDEGRPMSLAEVPDPVLDAMAGRGFDLVWLMGVWRTGEAGRRRSLEIPDLRREYDQALPGWTESDVPGSPYAIVAYEVAPVLGGDAALATLRARLATRGIGLILDFVPNHTALDNPWVSHSPHLYVSRPGGPPDGAATGCLGRQGAADCTVAFGRDPYFPPWTDTAQLDYRSAETRRAMTSVLVSIGQRCDGVRCDMAMLVLDEVFRKTWSDWPTQGNEMSQGEFWPGAITTVRARFPQFVFIAEAYWGLEYRLQCQGFDYTYDKTLYDRLVHTDPSGVRSHLDADIDYQNRKVRFLENHDEPRLARSLPWPRLRPALTLAMTLPGLRFVHEGQIEGRQVKIPCQMDRRPTEPADQRITALHGAIEALWRHPAVRRGSWRKLAIRPLFESDSDGADGCIAMRWDGRRAGSVLIVVNLTDRIRKVKIPLDLVGIAGRTLTLTDALGGPPVRGPGDRFGHDGVPLDLEPYAACGFSIPTI